jgi:hypothetical protein
MRLKYVFFFIIAGCHDPHGYPHLEFILFFYCFFLIAGCHESHDGYPHFEFQQRRTDASDGESGKERGTQVLKFTSDFTCFNGTKIQIPTLRTLRILHTATSLLVQKYKY